MTNPPNRIGGIRGPNGATLDDVVTALSSLNSGITAIGLDIAAMRAQMDYLVGVPDPQYAGAWTGLPNNFLSALGLNREDEYGVLNTLVAIRTAIGGLDRALYYNPANAGPNPSLVEITQQLLTAVGPFAGGPITNTSVRQHLGIISGHNAEAASTLVALLTALGSYASAPADTTVKQLLDALVACCEESGGGGGGTNPEPTSTCDGPWTFGPVRSTAFTLANGPPSFRSTTGQDCYFIDFGSLLEASPLVAVDVNGTSSNVPQYAYVPNDDIDICVSWNLTGNAVPTNVYIRRMGTSDYYNDTGNADDIFGTVGIDNSALWSINTSVRFGVFFEVGPGGAIPDQNFWLKIRTTPQ